MKVAIIGASFAKAAYLPALNAVDSGTDIASGVNSNNKVEVVAIASANISSAQGVADQFSIPNVYDDWRRMLDTHKVDLVCVVTPTVYHSEMVIKALEGGAHVICEKPMAMNSDQARQMLDKAESLGRIHMIGHELRFNPNRRKIKQLIDSGYIGKVRHVNITIISGTWGDPTTRSKGDWWSLDEMGGGRLGASGSHQIDLLRWWLGDIGAISGQLTTMVRDRIDKATGDQWIATADDQVSMTLEMINGALGFVFLSSAARHSMGNQVQIFGSEGTIKIAESDEKLWVARAGEDFQDMTERDPNADLPGIGKGIWNVSFVGLMRELIGAIREQRRLREGATFADGLKTQQAMDGVRQSWLERRWMTLD
ncbi:MAG: Gfo/Idh/MocA family oxidoreductase [Anaerolineae bacterium]|nr:Gfo/Idh/MocA family oxidoreductase [Anaerolineae bacterium]